jgi:hypothetical protein
LNPPAGGIVLREPGAGWDRGRSTVNGKPAQWKNKELRIRRLPAQIRIEAATQPNNQPTNKTP